MKRDYTERGLRAEPLHRCATQMVIRVAAKSAQRIQLARGSHESADFFIVPDGGISLPAGEICLDITAVPEGKTRGVL
jgi:hypothetical protein